jgi:hypothetical protein
MLAAEVALLITVELLELVVLVVEVLVLVVAMLQMEPQTLAVEAVVRLMVMAVLEAQA